MTQHIMPRIYICHLLVFLLSCAGCANKHPLVTKAQAKLVSKENKSMRGVAPAVQEKIRTAGTIGALIVTPRDNAASPIILPANDPIEGAKANLGAVSSGETCAFVFRDDVALLPEQLSCARVSRQASDELAIRGHFQQLQTAITAHDAALKNIVDELQMLENAYRHNTEVIGGNTQQIEALIAEVNHSFAELKHSFAEMNDKLDAIK